MRFLGICFLIVAMQPLSSNAQQAAAARPGGAYDLWLVRSQTITEDLIKDSAALTSSKRALMLATLAQTWWRDDPEKAHLWMLKSIEFVEAVPNRENPEERNQRLTTARMLLRIVTPLDQKLAKRVLAVLTQAIEQATEADRTANANGIIEAAISLVDTDPQRAAELGALALRVGRSTQIVVLISRLFFKDPKQGSALFAQMIEVVHQTLDQELINSLTQMIFPELVQPGARKPELPDSMRIELLKLDLAYLQANPVTAENKSSVCTNVISYVAPVLVYFDRLLPQQANIARQAINQCQSGSPLASQRVDDALRDQPLDTVDELLKAAADAEDYKVGTVYLFRAASLAKEQNEIDRALKILDSMSTESRAFMGGSWEDYRWDWAALSALRHFKSGDVYGMRLVMNAVPADLQVFAKLRFVSQLPDTSDKDTDPTLEFLNDARKGLGRSSIADAQKIGWYFTLLRLAVKFQPADATDVLKEVVTALNHAAEAEKQKTSDEESFSTDRLGISGGLSASLIELNEFAVREAVSSISSAETRTLVRLELIGICLERMRNSKDANPNKTRST
ncbi:MAG TPA: hypothetical protein VGO68_05025 [Pyrinomonadaceae bacterium]|nr:hypothetical protein [Pyrinomonadaceae bacterium]